MPTSMPRCAACAGARGSCLYHPRHLRLDHLRDVVRRDAHAGWAPFARPSSRLSRSIRSLSAAPSRLSAEVFSQLQRTLGAQERVQELLRETGELGEEAIFHASHPQRRRSPRFRGDVEFAGVSFSYPLATRSAGLGATFPSPPAPGKRSLSSARAARANRPSFRCSCAFTNRMPGRILIDGAEASTLALGTVRGNMSIVPTGSPAFRAAASATISPYGRPGATEEEILEASRRAHCHEFITAAFPRATARSSVNAE